MRNEFAGTAEAVFQGRDLTINAVGTTHGTVHLPDADGTGQATLIGHGGFIGGAAFRPDGTLLATAGEDRSVRVRSVADRESVAALRTGSPLGEVHWLAGRTIAVLGRLGRYVFELRPAWTREPLSRCHGRP